MRCNHERIPKRFSVVPFWYCPQCDTIHATERPPIRCNHSYSLRLTGVYMVKQCLMCGVVDLPDEGSVYSPTLPQIDKDAARCAALRFTGGNQEAATELGRQITFYAKQMIWRTT